MQKIPLEKTIGAAYRFFFSNILSILGTVWFPLLLSLVIIGAVVYAVLPASFLHGDLRHLDPAEITALVPLFLAINPLIVLISIVLSAMISVGLMQRALGMTHGPTLIYFSLGAPVWRMVGARILFTLAMIALIVAVALVCVAIVLAGRMLDSKLISGLLDAVVIVGAICVILYSAVRLFFFLPAVVVAEERISFSRAWALGRGSFWRIVLIWLMIVIPVGFVSGTIFSIVTMGSLAAIIGQAPHDHPSPEEVVRFVSMFMSTLLPGIILYVVIQNLALYGLWFGAVGSAYRAVVPASPPAGA
ncbi:MAG: hypothetical protein HY243_13025 [Proteobacteria bacterium]|nr:hypothetical protein [Pseudomonadota bacterium]